MSSKEQRASHRAAVGVGLKESSIQVEYQAVAAERAASALRLAIEIASHLQQAQCYDSCDARAASCQLMQQPFEYSTRHR